MATASRLSVPSSSGSGLQHIPVYGEDVRTVTFSPLLIGERSATPGCARSPLRCDTLSVPSSSGSGLQQAKTWVNVPFVHIFQSPPHRGAVCNTVRKRQSGQRPCSFQSPPHRGAVCNVFWSCATKPASSGFQSPPHRGAVCNYRSGLPLAYPRGDFQSPPHRGAVCNARRPPASARAPAAFQSPPHRGAVCNPLPAVRGAGITYPFSPLLIGERSATRVTRRAARLQGDLSVPSSSGSGLQQSFRGCTKGSRLAFSPLLIGERSATACALYGGPEHFAFQSPPHRGAVCNAHPPRYIHQLLVHFQSPPHRGAVCNGFIFACPLTTS